MGVLDKFLDIMKLSDDDDDYETAPVPSDRRNDPDGASDDGDSPKAAVRAQGDAPELKEDNPDRKTKKDKNKSGK